MKYLYYGGVVLLASLMLVLIPHGNIDTVEASADPIVWQFSPSTVNSLEFSGAYIEITGANWPSEMHGLSAHLVNDDEWLQLETISYVPVGGRMVVMIPAHSQTSDDNTYDLILMKISGARTVLENAFTVTGTSIGGDDEEDVVEEEEVTEEDTTSVDRPTVEVFKANGVGPSIIGYYPDVIKGNPYGGTTLTILGHGWPDEMYGLTVQIRNATTGDMYNCTTISYVPISGRLVVQTPSIVISEDMSLDIFVSDNQGGRTVLKDGLWYEVS